MRKTLLVAMALGFAACSHEQPPAQSQYGTAQTTAGPVTSTGAGVVQPVEPAAAAPAVTSGVGNATVGAGAADARQEVTSELAGWHPDLPHAALSLMSLNPGQMRRIVALVEQRTAANARIRAAHATLLSAVADGLESGTMTDAALAPKVQAVVAAIEAAEPVDRQIIEKLHGVLTFGQRSELVDLMEARMQVSGVDEEPGKSGHLGWLSRQLALTADEENQITSNLNALKTSTDEDVRAEAKQRHIEMLEAFRYDGFTMNQTPPVATGAAIQQRMGYVEHLAEAAAPVLTLQQRAAAAFLRAKAANTAPR